jgi:hypothetical protein
VKHSLSFTANLASLPRYAHIMLYAGVRPAPERAHLPAPDLHHGVHRRRHVRRLLYHHTTAAPAPTTDSLFILPCISCEEICPWFKPWFCQAKLQIFFIRCVCLCPCCCCLCRQVRRVLDGDFLPDRCERTNETAAGFPHLLRIA